MTFKKHIYTSLNYEELICFYQPGWYLSGGIGTYYFDEIRNQLKVLGASYLAEDHFSDMSSIDIKLDIGGAGDSDPDHPFHNIVGLWKLSTGRDPRRYIADIYVPIDVWLNQPYDAPFIREFIAECMEELFEKILEKAERKKGRLINKTKTKGVFEDILTKFRAMRTQLKEGMPRTPPELFYLNN